MNNWSTLHKKYESQDWISKPSLFAETAVEYFPKTGTILELGCGHGQDSLFFATKGYDVTATDIITESLTTNVTSAPKEISKRITVQTVDLQQPLPFSDASFDVVYAHLSLHYFDSHTTRRIFEDIQRILKPDGILAFFTNSRNDPEYKTGKELEDGYFEINGVPKRFLDVDEALGFANTFKVLLADNQGVTYKDSAKGVHNLIRFIGQKI